MARECQFCGKKTTVGRTYVYRGLPKYKGGIGLKITGKTKRKFKPNIQKVTAKINGQKQKVKICTRCLKSGVITK